MSSNSNAKFVPLEVEHPIWDRFFTVAPLVIVGSREPTGEYDLAPKHMATPLSWDNYFGFVCTPEHGTYQNIKRESAFTVSFPYPDDVMMATFASSPRCDDQSKPALQTLPTVAAKTVNGVYLENAYLVLECKLDRIVDGFGKNSLIAGQIVGALVNEKALRRNDRDDQDVLQQSPLLAYLPPGRYASIDHSFSFPFPRGFKRDGGE